MEINPTSLHGTMGIVDPNEKYNNSNEITMTHMNKSQSFTSDISNTFYKANVSLKIDENYAEDIVQEKLQEADLGENFIEKDFQQELDQNDGIPIFHENEDDDEGKYLYFIF